MPPRKYQIINTPKNATFTGRKFQLVDPTQPDRRINPKRVALNKKRYG